MSYSKDIGNWAEDQACQHLEKHGWQVVARNFFCRGGELDIVATKTTNLAFVEVKYRRNNPAGAIINSITRAKQQRLIRAAGYYLRCNPKYSRYNSRFDFIGVTGRQDQQIKLMWLPHIFIPTN